VYQSNRFGTFNYAIPGLTAGGQLQGPPCTSPKPTGPPPGKRTFNVAINGQTVTDELRHPGRRPVQPTKPSPNNSRLPRTAQGRSPSSSPPSKTTPKVNGHRDLVVRIGRRARLLFVYPAPIAGEQESCPVAGPGCSTPRHTRRHQRPGRSATPIGQFSPGWPIALRYTISMGHWPAGHGRLSPTTMAGHAGVLLKSVQRDLVLPHLRGWP